MKRFTLLIATLILAASIGVTGPQVQAQEAENHSPGVGYSHAWMTDSTQNGKAVPMDWWYPISDTTGLSQASVELGDGTQANHYGYHDMPGVHAGGFDRIVGTHPIIVFSHGTTGIGYQNYGQFTRLAQAGYIVAAPTHIGHSIIDIALNAPVDDWPATNIKRNLDMRFAINATIYIFNQKYNGDLITMGHSMGGMTALTVPTGLPVYNLPGDTRVDAVVAIAPSSFTLELGGSPLSTLNSLSKPVLILESLADQIVRHDHIDSIIQNLPFTPYTDHFVVPLADHNATANAWELNETVQASNLNQRVKDWLTQDVAWICHAAAGPKLDCQNRFHGLQHTKVTDFLGMSDLAA